MSSKAAPRLILIQSPDKDFTAGFVCASAIGMALGPFLALPLGQMPDVRVGLLLFNYITTAGWIMIAAWLAFIALWLTTFKDPLAE